MHLTRLTCLFGMLALLVTAGLAQQPSSAPTALSYSAKFVDGGRAGDLEVDAAGRLYLAGTICEDGVLTPTANAFQPSRRGGCDGFVVVIGADRRLLYATYLGGSRQDRIDGIAVDAQGSIYVVGDTASSDFPTTAGAFDRVCGVTGVCESQLDGFVTKIATTGALAYSTLLGGSQNDFLLGVAVDAAGRAHVAGYTSSPDYPTTAGAASSSYNARDEATYTRVEPAGNAISYSTYVSGERSEYALSVALDDSGAAYVVGQTQSAWLTTFNALQPSHGGLDDAWLMKVAANGTLQFITYLGGSALDTGMDVAVRGGYVYVTGATCSPDFPGVSGAAPACMSSYAARVKADGSAVDKTGIVDGSRARAIAVDDQANAYVFAQPENVPGGPTFAPTPDAFQPAPAATGSMILAMLSFAGSGPPHLAYGTYAGDGGIPESIKVFGRGVVLGGLFIGHDDASTFPMVNAPYSTDRGGSFAMHFVPESALVDNTDGEITLYAEDASAVAGNWRLEFDASAARGRRLTNPDLAVAKLSAPRANPGDYVEFTFDAEAGVAYRLWLRGRAARDHWSNDSVFVQFSDTVDQAGGAIWRIGSADATTVNLEDCAGCALEGWGWQDNGWGVNVLGPPVRFASTGRKTLRIQPREDGFSFDQIVLSASRYLSSAPGPLKDATTVLPRSNGSDEPVADTTEIVLHTASAATRGGWAPESRTDAASGLVVRHPDAGAAKLKTVPVPAANYFEISFEAEANLPYRLWIRSRADRDYWGNDSVFVQFSDSVDASGAAVWRIGGASATEVNLEDCSGCGIRGWGWQDNGWGVGVQGPLVRFATPGRHVIRVVTREDGLSVDQIVLSSARYLNTSPGALKNDATILPATQ